MKLALSYRSINIIKLICKELPQTIKEYKHKGRTTLHFCCQTGNRWLLKCITLQYIIKLL